MDRTLTERVYQCIREYTREHGYPPTLREIADCCYVSRGNVIRHLDKLEAQGRIAREPGRARSIRILG